MPKNKATCKKHKITRAQILYVLPMAAFIILLIYLYWDLPLPNQITSKSKNPVSTQLLDRNGKLIYEIFEEKRRTPISLKDLPVHVAQATVSIEDKDFYQHHGFSVSGITRALYRIFSRKRLEGGSTITQQLVKTTLLTPERTIKRKIREFTLSVIIDSIYPKDKILEMYLNNVPYGGTAWGIEAASQNYFGKPAKDLSLAEASLLAGLPQAPTKFSPFGVNPQLAEDRQLTVLRRMVEDGYITGNESENAKNTNLEYIKQEGIKAPHFALLVKEQLVEKYGEQVVELGGLRVTTTLDLDLQEAAQTIVKEEITKLKKANVGNGSALITNPQTGEVYAMVGSYDYFATDEDGKVNITLRERQPGSSIKPINYALGIKNGTITASSPLADIPTCFSVIGQELYCPVNYDGSFHGAIQTRFALGNSYNIPAVRTLAINGLKEFVEFAKQMGLSTLKDPKNYGLSITLGGGEVRMIDMNQAFGIFANSGIKQDIITILKVTDWQNKVYEETKFKEGNRIIPKGVAYIISHILLDNNARSSAFGTSSLLNVSGHPEVSVKTGTTNDKRDNWTIGFTPEIVTAVWVGNNDNEPMSAVASGITGASPIWNKITKLALDKIESGNLGSFNEDLEKHSHVWMSKPSDVVGTNICATSGSLPPGPEDNPDCPIRFEFFLEEFPPKPTESQTLSIPVFKDTGMPANSDASPEQTEIREHQILFDPLGTQICLDCPLPTWAIIIKSSDIPKPKKHTS